MPDTSKLFKKRLSEDGYKQLQSFLDASKTFDQLGSEAKKVLNAITKSEQDRSFDEQETLFEMKTRLVIDKYITSTDAFEKFENFYRTFMLGETARHRLFSLKDHLTDSVESKVAPVDITRDVAVEKWNKRAIENFWDDKEELPGFEEEYRGMSLEDQKLEYKRDFFSWLEDPENTMGMAAEYRRDLGGVRDPFNLYRDVPPSKVSPVTPFDPHRAEPLLPAELEMVPSRADIKGTRVSKGGFRTAEGPVVPKGFSKVLNTFLNESKDAFKYGTKGLTVYATKFKNWVTRQAEDIGGNLSLMTTNLFLGAAVTEVLDFVGKMSHMDKHGQHVMNFLVTEGLATMQLSLATGPVGAILGVGALLVDPIIKLVNFLGSSPRRRKQNDDPEQIYGRQFARVRAEDEQGNVKWFPGFLASKNLWTGVGSKEQSVRINYGKLEDLHWRFNKDGTFSPYFENPRYRMINATNDDLTNYASEKQRAVYDVLRDYSLMTNDETDKLFRTLVKGGDVSEFQEQIDDRSKLPKYTQELLSFRDDFEWIRKFNSGGEKIGRHLEAADRGLRREFQHSYLANPDYIEGSDIYYTMMSDTRYKKGYTKFNTN